MESETIRRLRVTAQRATPSTPDANQSSLRGRSGSDINMVLTGRLWRPVTHLNSGAVTSILASCGSSGNSAIISPTCQLHGAAIEDENRAIPPGAREVRAVNQQAQNIACRPPHILHNKLKYQPECPIYEQTWAGSFSTDLLDGAFELTTMTSAVRCANRQPLHLYTSFCPQQCLVRCHSAASRLNRHLKLSSGED